MTPIVVMVEDEPILVEEPEELAELRGTPTAVYVSTGLEADGKTLYEGDWVSVRGDDFVPAGVYRLCFDVSCGSFVLRQKADDERLLLAAEYLDGMSVVKRAWEN